MKHAAYLFACLLTLTAVAVTPGASALQCYSTGGNIPDQVAETCNEAIAAVYGGNIVRDMLDAVDHLCENQLGHPCIP